MDGFQVCKSVNVRPGYSDMNVPQLAAPGIWSHLSQVAMCVCMAGGSTGMCTATPAPGTATGSGTEGPDIAEQNWEVC